MSVLQQSKSAISLPQYNQWITGRNGNIYYSGNVAINTRSDPLYNLDVSGTSNISGNIIINGEIKNNNFQTSNASTTQFSYTISPKGEIPTTSVGCIVATVTCDRYCKKDISFNIPLSSYSTGSGPNRPNTIDAINCFILDSTNKVAGNPLVSLNNTLPITKTVSSATNITMEQYFTNATLVFRPPFRSHIDTYKIQLYLSGTGTFNYNTDVSGRRIITGGTYNSLDGTGYTIASYTETPYTYLDKIVSVNVNRVDMVESNVSVCNQLAATNITGGDIYSSNYYINNIHAVTLGFAMSNTSPFSNDATNKIRIFNNNNTSFFDFTSSGDSSLTWRYGTSYTTVLTLNGSNGDLRATGSVYASATKLTSDYRLKQNVQLLSETNKSIDELKPIEYDLSGGNHDMGFLAHEVQEIFPFLVNGEKDGKEFQSINYNGFIALLVKEIQDLKKNFNYLKNNFDDLKKEMNDIKNKIYTS